MRMSIYICRYKYFFVWCSHLLLSVCLLIIDSRTTASLQCSLRTRTRLQGAPIQLRFPCHGHDWTVEPKMLCRTLNPLLSVFRLGNQNPFKSRPQPSVLAACLGEAFVKLVAWLARSSFKGSSAHVCKANVQCLTKRSCLRVTGLYAKMSPLLGQLRCRRAAFQFACLAGLAHSLAIERMELYEDLRSLRNRNHTKYLAAPSGRKSVA